MIRASSYLEDRAGYDAFAVVDSTGREYGLNAHRTYVSASVTKSMLLVAYLRALAAHHESLGPESKKLLYPMIHVSDNTAASTVWTQVGDDGLTDVARAAGMRDFSFGANWANESMSPADMARFFYGMDSLIPRRFRGYARQLLSGIDRTESWGIPAAARPRHWRVYFKGGWRRTGDGQLVSQVARLERHHRRIAIAVMTVEDPSMGYGAETIAGVVRHGSSRLTRAELSSAPERPPEHHDAQDRDDQRDDRDSGTDRPDRGEHDPDDADNSGDATDNDELVGALLTGAPRGVAPAFLNIGHTPERTVGFRHHGGSPHPPHPPLRVRRGHGRAPRAPPGGSPRPDQGRQEAGHVTLAGALGDPPHAGAIVFQDVDKSHIEAFTRDDPYVTAGLVVSQRIEPWRLV